MTHRHHAGGHGCGPRRGRPGVGSRDDWLRALQRYQRDLEQEIADVADLIARLSDRPEPEPQTV